MESFAIGDPRENWRVVMSLSGLVAASLKDDAENEEKVTRVAGQLWQVLRGVPYGVALMATQCVAMVLSEEIIQRLIAEGRATFEPYN